MEHSIKNFAKTVYKIIVPPVLREKRMQFLRERLGKKLALKRKELREEILDYFNNNVQKYQTTEEKQVFEYLAHNPLSVFPYDFTKKYRLEDNIIYTDENCKMKYVLHGNKRMYFPKGQDEIGAQRYYRSLLVEQDIDSPHRYELGEFYVREGDILVDVGAAEGIFGLSVIEKIKKLYLFECSEPWIEALEKTFEPWKEKVVIVNKYISDHCDDTHITLDEFLEGKTVNFIKADIEGAELSLLHGAKKTLASQPDLRIVLCTYHRQNDAKDLEQLLAIHGFQTELSKGYMLFIYDKNFAPPYLRKGVIRATKIKAG